MTQRSAWMTQRPRAVTQRPGMTREVRMHLVTAHALAVMSHRHVPICLKAAL